MRSPAWTFIPLYLDKFKFYSFVNFFYLFDYFDWRDEHSIYTEYKRNQVYLILSRIRFSLYWAGLQIHITLMRIWIRIQLFTLTWIQILLLIKVHDLNLRPMAYRPSRVHFKPLCEKSCSNGNDFETKAEWSFDLGFDFNIEAKRTCLFQNL